MGWRCWTVARYLPSNGIRGIESSHDKSDKKISDINTYRLEAFKQKAENPSNQRLTILALAFDSGFNSKTVFNTFFKKMMGMTPKEYWKGVSG